MQQSEPVTAESVAAQQSQQADENKAKGLEWLRARAAEAQALYLTIDNGIARVTYRGFLAHEPPHYFHFKAAPGHEVHGVDFATQTVEIEAPRQGLGVGESVNVYLAMTTPTGKYRMQRDVGTPQIRIHTQPIY